MYFIIANTIDTYNYIEPSSTIDLGVRCNTRKDELFRQFSIQSKKIYESDVKYIEKRYKERAIKLFPGNNNIDLYNRNPMTIIQKRVPGQIVLIDGSNGCVKEYTWLRYDFETKTDMNMWVFLGYSE